MFLHELGHVLRRDPLWQGLVQFTTALYWFHPCVWLAAWRIHVERERACDDLVLNRGIGAQDYARHLLDVVSQGRFRRIGASAGVAMASTNKLEGRVRSILDERQDRRPLTRTLLVAGVLTSLVVGTPLAMMRAEGQLNNEKTSDQTFDNEVSPSDDATNDNATDGSALATSEDGPEAESSANDEVVDDALEMIRINYDETMLVAWNEAGAVAVVFDVPEVDGDANGVESFVLTYRFRANNGTEREVTGEDAYALNNLTQLQELPFVNLSVVNATTTGATIAYDPRSVCVHPLDRTFFEEYDYGVDYRPEPRPPVDLTQFLLPDEDVQQQIGNRPYAGQASDPGYPRVPLTFKIRYDDNGLVVATPDGVAVFDFLGPLDRSEGNEQRQGVEYRWRFVSADGSTDETGEGEVWELSRDGQSVYSETLHHLEAGPIHIPWSLNYAEAGWIYYDPAFQGVWLIRPEVALELAEPETNAAVLMQFAFGPRALPLSADYSDEIRDEGPADEGVDTTGEHTLRGFNLSPYLFTSDWPSLYEPGAPLDRELAIPLGGVWRCVINPGNWRVHYSPLRGDFYAHHTVNVNADGEGESIYYGPIKGNPIELLRLENYIVESINQTHAAEIFGSPLEINALQSLIDSQEPTLVASGFRVLLELDSLEVNEALHLLPSFDAAAEWLSTMPENEDLVNETQAAMDRHSSRIEELKIEVPADEYMSRGTEPTAEELAANWGPEVDGLSLAIIPWEEGEPSLRLGERVEAWLAVRNMSAEPIRFSSYNIMDHVSTVLVDEETKVEQQIWFPAFDHWPVAMRFRLDPGQVIRLKHAAFWSGVQQLQDGSAQINVQPGHTYRLLMTLQLPESFQKNGEGRILVPARGEYFNQLESGVVRIRIAEIDGAVPPELGEVDEADMSDVDDATGSTNLDILRGFDFSDHRFEGDWTTLFAAGGPLERECDEWMPEQGYWRMPEGGFWRCRIKTDGWVIYYSSTQNTFYAQRGEEGDATHYGPITGDAIELLDLETFMIEGYNQPNPFYMPTAEFELLLTSRQPQLIATGLRAFLGFEGLSIFDSIFLRSLIQQAVALIQDNPEHVALADSALQRLAEYDAQHEELKVEADPSEYESGANPTADVLATNWGPAVDGLSMAWIPWAEGNRTIIPGESFEVALVVRNVSDGPIRFSTFGKLENCYGVLVDEVTGEKQRMPCESQEEWEAPQRYELQPGQVQMIGSTVIPTALKGAAETVPGIRLVSGHTYRLTAFMNLPEHAALRHADPPDNTLMTLAPARGEYENRLTSGVIRMQVAEVAVVPNDDADQQNDPSDPEVSSFPHSLHGFDLTPHRFTGEWEALFEIDGPLYRELPVALGGVWECRVNSHAWRMYYSPLKQFFYVHLRDGDASEYFGPIEGNAIELLRIEEHLVNSFNRAIGTDLVETSFNRRYIESLMESQEPTLMASGFRTLTQLQELAIYEEHQLWPIVERVANEAKTGWINDPTVPPEHVDQLPPREPIQVPELNDLADAAFAYMNEQHARIEALKVTIDDSEYTPGREPTEEELAADWGPDVDGLALAAMNWYVHPADSSTPVISKPLDTLPRHYWAAGEVPTLAVGGFITSQLLIRNVSDEPRKIATLNTMDGVGAEMIDEETGHSAILSYESLSGIPLTERYLLQAGEVVEIKRPHFQIVEGDLHPHERPFNPRNRDIIYGQIRVREGRSYRVEYYLNLPSAYSNDADGRITLPASGEFHGRLDAVPMRFEVGERLAAVTDNNESELEAVLREDESHATRMTPASEVDRELIDQILSWGSNERHGWRVGALLVNDLDTDEPLTAGETAAVQFFLQNVSDEPQTIRVQGVRETFPTMGAGGKINLNLIHGGENIEITAQPGEAVSPDGFAILIDTKGLPDGEYSVYTISAFSIPNENGNGGGSPWRVGSVPMTIGEGGEFSTEAVTDDDDITWGGRVAGLQVGMRMHNRVKEQPLGSLMRGAMFVRNVSDHPITFEWDEPAPLDQNQVVYDADGEYVRLNSVFYTGIRARNPQSFTLAPGDQVQVGSASLQSAAEPTQPGADEASQLVATTGEFTWTVHLQLSIPAIPQFTFVAGSGPVPIEIVNAEQPGAGEDDASNDPSQGGERRPDDAMPDQSDRETPSEQDANQEETQGTEVSEAAIVYPELLPLPAFPHEEQIRQERERLTRLIEETDLLTRASEFEDRISWGTPHDGWRVGMVIIGEDEVTAGDRVVVQFYLQNVTAEEQTLRLRKFSPSLMQILAGHNIIRFTASGESNEITDLVADAGEMVLLGGYLAELDTTGLPDGDYLIEANAGNHAYWIANEHGQASYDFHMAQCRLRIGEGGDPVDDPNSQLIPTDDQIWWGPDVAGLRLGMQMLDRQANWPVGSRIESVIYVMNSTDHDVTFDIWWELPSNLDMSVYAADEYVATRPSEEMTPIELDVRELIVFQDLTKRFTVPAGEMLELGHYFLDSRAEKEDFGAGQPPRLIAESGDYKWIGRLGFRRDDLDDFYCNMETGPAYFDLMKEE